MEEKLFSKFAELTPSYKAIGTQDVDFDVLSKNDKNKRGGRSNRKQDDDKKKTEEQIKQAKKDGHKVIYGPDMSEPVNYLGRLIPKILRGIVPAELRNLLVEKVGPSIEGLSDSDLLAYFGIESKAKVGSHYSLKIGKKGLDLVYVSEDSDGKEQTEVNDVKFSVMIKLVCVQILSDLSECLNDKEVYQSIKFLSMSRKITYNPFVRVASLIPMIGGPMPLIVGIILMDTKMSLVTLSFCLRCGGLSPEYTQFYRDRSKVDNAVMNINTQTNTYDLLLASGIYDRVRLNVSGKVRPQHSPRQVKARDWKEFAMVSKSTWEQ